MATKLCSKCGVNPRADADSTNPWCAECKRQANNVYQQALLLRAEHAGYTAGIRAMRDAVIARFAHWPSAHFSGAEVVSQVQTLAVPSD